MEDNALIVFSRLPVGSEAKTRLSPIFNEAQREKLMLAMWQDIFGELARLPASTQIFLYWTGSGDIRDYEKFLPAGFKTCRQSEGSLGVRMFNAVSQVIGSGYKRVALIGSDIPMIKHEYILEAFAMLDDYDCVLAPSLDGGYWLVAMSRVIREVFASDTWGNSSVLDSALKNLRNAGLTSGLARELGDIDTPDDVKNFLRIAAPDSHTYKFIRNAVDYEEYIANRFKRQPEIIYDDSFLSQWQEYIDMKALYSEAEILNKYIIYKRPVKFREPENITLEIFASAAGDVPVIILGNASDFEDFIVNLVYKGSRPDNISQMGASFIYGKNQRLLVLSKKFYSNTEPEYLGLSPEEWREKSMIIRREHECTHYYTKRFYGSASNNLHDELIADFMGMYEAFGSYNAKLFQHFIGNRLSLYTANLSQEVRDLIAQTACICSDYLEGFSRSALFAGMDKASRINHMCEISIKDMITRSSLNAV